MDEILRLGSDTDRQLLYCHTEPRDSKLRAGLRLVSCVAAEDGKLSLTVELKNTGEAILQNDGADALRVTARFIKNGEPLPPVMTLAALPSLVRPGDPPLTVTGKIKPPPEFDFIEVDVASKKGYALSELGMKKIILSAAQVQSKNK